MVVGLRDTAIHLWRGAPYWRLSVLGGALFTVLSAVYLWSGEGGPAPSPIRTPPATPAIAADPASDARLADYEAAHDQAAKVAAAGAQCEQMAGAYDALAPEDLKRGRNVMAFSRSRIAALAEGERCHDAIAKSNQHFDATARLVAAVQANPTPQALPAAFDSVKALDVFDRSRTRYQADGAMITQAQGYGTQLADSDARLHALQADAEAFQRDGSTDAAQRAAATLGALTPLDRARLGAPQQAALATAGDAARRVQDAKVRLSRVTRLFAAAQGNPSTENQQPLIDAVAAVSLFDQALATPEQKQGLDQARAAAISAAWVIGKQRIISLDKGAKADQLAAAAAVYDVLKDLPHTGLTDEQRDTLARAKSAADTLGASNARRHALTDAYTAWQQNGLSAGDVVLPAVAAISPFDQGRFNEAERKAWAVLVKADAILRGPEIGFTTATKDRMPILVQGGSSDMEARAAATLAGTLRRSGFAVANSQGEAALVLSVVLAGADVIQQDLSTGLFAWTTTVRMSFKLAWTVDNSVLMAGEVAQPGRAQDKTAVQAQAILADINLIAERVGEAVKR